MAAACVQSQGTHPDILHPNHQVESRRGRGGVGDVANAKLGKGSG